ncbi:crocetin glucosyltransferase 2-like protein [Cinnamomum micranthum f. kanehirae]|uniref:Crocetin glucosyltransferase 2-like protein n=1 Tax=Cinnamomum micranthum f. kanehirae TaxID=337451 RepID=A0A443NZE9_9MAGN|nr:crocetin glucosyltransferase 2-like protein [Cinnamomum micranthum f. kanehirae]
MSDGLTATLRSLFDEAHVLFLPYPAQGHINPTLQFAKRLVSKGLKAKLVTTIFITKTIEIEPGPVGVEPISDGCDEAGYAEAGSVEAYLERLEAIGSQTLAELIDN